MRLNCNSQRCFTQALVVGRCRLVDGVFNVRRSQVLTCSAVNRNFVAFLETVFLEQRVNTNCEVELDEEKENTKLGDLEAEKHSGDSKHKSED